MSEDPERRIWKKLADATKANAETPEDDLPKAEDFVEGPLPETAEEAAERQRKLIAAQRAAEAKAAEEADRLAQLQREEEELGRQEEAARWRIEEEARRHREEEERKQAEEAERKVREAEEQRRRIEEERIRMIDEEARRHREEEEKKLADEAERRKEEIKEAERRIREMEEVERRRREAEELKRMEEERLRRVEAGEQVEKKRDQVAEPSYAPEGENLLLQGLVNLIQPALDIKLESSRYQRWIKGWDRAIEMHIVGEGYTHVIIKDNQMKAGLGKPPKEPDIVMEGDYETITNYLNGELDPILMFFDFVLLRKVRLVKGLEIKLTSILDGSLFRQARDLYRIDKILRIK